MSSVIESLPRKRSAKAIVINPNNLEEFLVLVSPSRFDFVGGGVEEGESVPQALWRETEEETYGVRLLGAWKVHQHHRETDGGVGPYEQDFFLAVAKILGEMGTRDEHPGGLFWHRFDEVDKLENLPERYKIGIRAAHLALQETTKLPGFDQALAKSRAAILEPVAVA